VHLVGFTIEILMLLQTLNELQLIRYSKAKKFKVILAVKYFTVVVHAPLKYMTHARMWASHFENKSPVSNMTC
jgi:hypothetical protein